MIFDTEFWQCPTASWGMFIIGILNSIIIFAASKTGNPSIIKAAASLTGIVSLAWLLFTLFRFASRNPKCKRVGFPNGKYINPLP